MKFRRSKYTTLIILATLLLSCSMQVIWLRELFSSQQKQLKDDIENMVSASAQSHWFESIASFEKPENLGRARQLFLTPQWEQLRQAFDNMKMNGLISNLTIDRSDDSLSVSMNFRLADTPSTRINNHPGTVNTGMTNDQLREIDSASLAGIKKEIRSRLEEMNIHSEIYENIFTYNMDSLFETSLPPGVVPSYTSKKYIYGIHNHFRYQLSLADINNTVWYRMRYYVASSVLMLILTCAAFYLIVRLLQNVRLYADAKTDFTRNMTHELKTPIATVSVALESIKKYNLINKPETLLKYVDISQHEMRRLDLMVEKALNNDPEKNADVLFQPGLYDVQTGLQNVIDTMQLQLDNTHSTIIFHPSKEPCFVMGDEVHLSNIFYNLIDNAIKYKGKNLALEISCEKEAEAISIAFVDNGPGIRKIYHKNIFERFFRVPSEGDTHDVKGSGLGLYYVKKMVEMHKGTIKIKSEQGKGTTFIITLKSAS
ncbi:HAMP domain-containing sensor histidine kinase [Pollutibacter soli]|uniref:sensor histidine kinase n=1 Tax=Pollutibacter soli TaxID=3034157 RepID=UPI00301387A6